MVIQFVESCFTLVSTCRRVSVIPLNVDTGKVMTYWMGKYKSFFFSFVCYPIVGFYVLNSVLWCSLRFLYKSDVRFVFTSDCLCLFVSNTYWVVFLFCFSSSCVSYVASFSRWFILITPSVFSTVYLDIAILPMFLRFSVLVLELLWRYRILCYVFLHFIGIF